jgi:hypothetical protein
VTEQGGTKAAAAGFNDDVLDADEADKEVESDVV